MTKTSTQVPADTTDAKITPWRIERDAKLFFRVARNGEEGAEYVRSASGRVSSFRTYKAAQRALAAVAKATGAA